MPPRGRPGSPDDAIPLDPDAVRAAELAALDEQEQELNALDEDDESEVFRVTREILGSESARLQITRVLPVEKKGYVGEMSPTEFTMDRLKRVYGPGRYRIRVLGPRGFLPGGGTAVIAQEAEADEKLDLQKILETLDGRNRERSEAKKDRLVELTTILAAPVATLVAAILTRKPADNNVAALITALRPPDPLSQIAALKSLMPPPVAAPPDAIDRALKIVDLFKDQIGNGSAPVDGWGATIRKVIESAGPNIGAAFEKVMERLPAPGQGIPSAPAAPIKLMPRPSADIVAPQQPPAGTQAQPGLSPALGATIHVPPGVAPDAQTEAQMQMEFLKLLPWFKPQIEQLLVRAARDINPDLAAEIFIADFPDDVNADVLMPLLERADWFELFAQLDGRVRNYSGWFASMHAALLTELKAMQAEAAQAGESVSGAAPVAPV